ncbi:MAG: redoxin family protein [Gemmataceae bacterium]|nr:redoxin family protein [Gemmataceae bacterium]
MLALLLMMGAAGPPHFTARHTTLLRPGGKPARFADYAGRRGTVVVFASLPCPVSRSYHALLGKLAKEWEERGVNAVAVLPSDDVPPGISKEARDAGLTLPLFIDRGMKLAVALGASTTPEAALLDDDGHLVYRGRIDDAWSERLKRNAKAEKHDLRDAVEVFLTGKGTSRERTRAVGCPIVFARKEPDPKARATYRRDVAPLLARHCAGCHRDGGAGPFALASYKQARHWADDIKHFTRTRQMPPWSPAAGVPFQNDRRLSAAEIAILSEWADAGAPEGDGPVPAPPKASDEWAMGEPDLVLSPSTGFELGPTGSDLFRVFPLPMGLTEDRWVVAYDVKPGAAHVVHHTLHYFDATGTGRKLEKARKDALGPGYTVSMGIGFAPPAPKPGELPRFGGIGGRAPGQAPQKLPRGAGMLLPAGSDFLLQVHYHRDGKPARDWTKVGLYFAKGRIEQPWQTVVVRGMPARHKIPAGEAVHRLKRSVWLRTDAVLHNVMPHMHLLGKSVKVTMTPPDGKPAVLVDIPSWDYRWQETYWFRTPIKAAAGTRLEVEGVFDNSAGNPLNPSRPPRDVREGEETTDEMLYAFLGATSASSPWSFIGYGETPGLKGWEEARRLLSQRVGEWDAETTAGGAAVKGTDSTSWTLGGRFIESKGKTALGETRMLAGWDEGRKAFRYWYFDGAGTTSEGQGEYDEKTKSIRWRAEGATAVWRFASKDRLEWSWLSADGKSSMKGTMTRRAKPAR